jgi:hypothetical protein
MISLCAATHTLSIMFERRIFIEYFYRICDLLAARFGAGD